VGTATKRVLPRFWDWKSAISLANAILWSSDDVEISATKGVFLFEFRCRLATKISGSNGAQSQRFGPERRRFCAL
jgi:hypothetical protein